MKSRAGGRYIKCGSDDCTGAPQVQNEASSLRFKPSFSYPIPRSGRVVKSGEVCDKHNLPVLVIVKSKPQNMVFFWVNGPCFACMDSSKCSILADLKNEEW